jgi:hypothetical protein
MLYGQSSGWWIRGNIESLIKYLQMILNSGSLQKATSGNTLDNFYQ